MVETQIIDLDLVEQPRRHLAVLHDHRVVGEDPCSMMKYHPKSYSDNSLGEEWVVVWAGWVEALDRLVGDRSPQPTTQSSQVPRRWHV